MNLEQLVDRCKAGVYLEVNVFRNDHQTPQEAMEEINQRGSMHGNAEDEPEIDDELATRIVATNSLYELQFYPHTPVGFYVVYGTSLKEVLDKAFQCLEARGSPISVG